MLGWRPRDLATANVPQLRGHCLANYFSDPRFAAMLGKSPQQDPRGAVMKWTTIFGNPLTWDDLPWLRSLTKLPLILKGVCHPDDVQRAIDGGVDGIYCSNHGGRQANGGIAALDMLPAVCEIRRHRSGALRFRCAHHKFERDPVENHGRDACRRRGASLTCGSPSPTWRHAFRTPRIASSSP